MSVIVERSIQMSVIGLNHISMKCDSAEELERIIPFYRDILGLTVAKRWPDGVLLDTSNGMLEIFCNGKAVRALGAIRHFALEVTDAASLADKVRGAGFEVFVEPKEITVPAHAVIAFCFGPLGEQIEFFQPLER